jgi:perosamine synthetase
LGYNYRLTETQAALGSSQLERVEEGIQKRIDAAAYYTEKFCSPDFRGIITPYKAPNRSHVFHLYVIKVQSADTGITRNELFRKLTDNGIGVSVHYTPLHLFSFYKNFLNSDSMAFPTAERIYDQILSLPLFPTLTKNNIDFVTQKIHDIIKGEI